MWFKVPIYKNSSVTLYQKIKPGDYNKVDVSFPTLTPNTPGTLLGARRITPMSVAEITEALVEVDLTDQQTTLF
ncbi:MAG: hypothetical protein P8P91_12440 [Pseudomonadales bacterium]|nr:hypothetical protein [Pseudomonadales bacterium]